MEKRKRKSRKRKEKEQQPQIIGVMGAGPGAGTTHFAVWLANYLCGMRREKTALLEWNLKGDVARIGRSCLGGWRRREFELLEVDYFGEASDRELARCLNLDYRHIIIDFGDNYKDRWTEFQRCGRRFLVISLSEWQQQAFVELVGFGGREGLDGCQLLVAFGSEESRREVMRNLKTPLLRIPYSVDAFAITREAASFFETVI